jgi:Flp pilus assembly pilin Flp
MSKALVAVNHRLRNRSDGRALRIQSVRRALRRSERGAATAEYAVSVVAVCGLGGILVALLKSDAMMNALKALINYALQLAGVEGVQL